jgi:hypothetical protein
LDKASHNPSLKLFMVLLGCKPQGRLTEQHDVFFGIAEDLKTLVPEMKAFWPEAKGLIHIDAWREVTSVKGYPVRVMDGKRPAGEDRNFLFFINLGGYKPGEFEEYHYKLLAVGNTSGQAILQAKETAFYKHTGFRGALSHVDDKYGLDTDDLFKVEDVLRPALKGRYWLSIEAPDESPEDLLHIGYTPLKSLT